MAMHAPTEVRDFFLLVTGEQWPTADEDQLRELAVAWRRTADAIGYQLAPEVERAVIKGREAVEGSAARGFAETMARFTVEEPHYFRTLVDNFRGMADFLDKTALEVEYVKIMAILSL